MAIQQQDVLLAIALQNQIIAVALLKRKKQRSVWVRKLWQRRKLQDNLIMIT